MAEHVQRRAGEITAEKATRAFAGLSANQRPAPLAPQQRENTVGTIGEREETMSEREEERRAAWLPVPSGRELPAEVIAAIGPVADKVGFVPNIARLLALTPRHFVGWWSYFDDLMRGASGLTKTQREMIAVVVSVEARCPY